MTEVTPLFPESADLQAFSAVFEFLLFYELFPFLYIQYIFLLFEFLLRYILGKFSLFAFDLIL